MGNILLEKWKEDNREETIILPRLNIDTTESKVERVNRHRGIIANVSQ